MLNNHEIENLEDKIIMTLRRNGSYSVPKASIHVYTPIIAVLDKMNDDGLVVKSDGLNKIIFTATERLSPTVIVRGITADKVRTGFQLCVQKNDKIVARVNSRSREVYAKDVDFLGVVCSVETKEFPANIWEKLTFQKNSVKTVIRFKYKTLVVDPAMELMKVR